jgi:hypothetical protein
VAKAPPGCVTVDFQGPFTPDPHLIEDGASPFVCVDLFSDPHVGIFVTSQAEADLLIAAFRKARGLLPKVAS